MHSHKTCDKILKFFFQFQLVIVMEMGQMTLHVMTMVYAIVMLTLSMTNVMHVMLDILTFLHVIVSNTMNLLQDFLPYTSFIKFGIMFVISFFSL